MFDLAILFFMPSIFAGVSRPNDLILSKVLEIVF
jgi:hypothetical protein